MTYRLQDGALEVLTKIDNLSTEPMPVAIGFHPYFQVNDAPRDEWTIGIAARSEWLLTPDKVPTGEKRPIEQLLAEAAGRNAGSGRESGPRIRRSGARRVGARDHVGQGQIGADRCRLRAELKAVVVYAPRQPEHSTSASSR